MFILSIRTNLCQFGSVGNLIVLIFQNKSPAMNRKIKCHYFYFEMPKDIPFMQRL